MRIDAALAAKLRAVLERLAAGKTLAAAAAEVGLGADDFDRVMRALHRQLASIEASIRQASGRGLALIAYADGGSRGNPGQAACAAVICDASGEELLRRAKRLGKATNNVAEYEAVLLALDLCRQLGATNVVLRLDSELVARQVEGRYKVKHPDLAKLHARVREAASAFASFTVEQVPRLQNAVADELVNAALDGREVD